MLFLRTLYSSIRLPQSKSLSPNKGTSTFRLPKTNTKSSTAAPKSINCCFPFFFRRTLSTTTTTKPKKPTMPKTHAEDFINFVNASPSPFHAVDECRSRLLNTGFTELKEKNDWTNVIKPNGKYFFTRNKSTIVAFAVGGKWTPGHGFSMVAAHTDSPCLKVKPVSKKEKCGYLQVGVQLYGGGLWHTWFDRDLSVAGRVLVQQADGSFKNEIVRIDRTILKIPTLAIHLDRGVNSDGFKFNLESQLQPILCSALTGTNGADKDKPQSEKHHHVFLELLANELKCKVSQIEDFELCLFDTQPSAIGGLQNEYIFSPRCDNLVMSFCGTAAFINSCNAPDSLAKDDHIRLLALFDNEEVGSQSAYGADSLLLESTLRRITNSIQATSQSAFEEALHKSFLVSADMAHAIHPNYSDKHEDNHRPAMNKGVVIKMNANQRYATTAPTALLFREIARKRSIPLQEFVVRNDSPCGSTIGPILSSHLGLRTLDIGNPQLSMHSIRETAGTQDVTYAVELFEEFWDSFGEVDAKIIVD